MAGVYSKETVEQEYSLSTTAHFYSFWGRTRSDWDFDISEKTFQTFLLYGAYSDPSGCFQSCTHQTAAPGRHLSKDSTLAMTYSPLLFRLRSSRRHFFKKTELKVQGAISLEPIISTSRTLPGGFLKVLQGLNLPWGEGQHDSPRQVQT